MGLLAILIGDIAEAFLLSKMRLDFLEEKDVRFRTKKWSVK
jgi:hypothetical protein